MMLKGETNPLKIIVYIIVFVICISVAFTLPIDGFARGVALMSIIGIFLIFFWYGILE